MTTSVQAISWCIPCETYGDRAIFLILLRSDTLHCKLSTYLLLLFSVNSIHLYFATSFICSIILATLQTTSFQLLKNDYCGAIPQISSFRVLVDSTNHARFRINLNLLTSYSHTWIKSLLSLYICSVLFKYTP